MADKNHQDRFTTRDFRSIGLGFEFAGSAVLFCLIGYLIDYRWDTHPVGIMVGALVGIIVGGYLLIKNAILMGQNDSQDRTNEPGNAEQSD